MDLVKTLPPTPSGHVEMDAHYSACKQATDCIAGQIIAESDNQRASRDHLVSSTRSPVWHVSMPCLCFCKVLRCIVLCRRCEILRAFAELHGSKDKAPERRSKGGAPERRSKGGAPERRSKGGAPERRSKGRAPERRSKGGPSERRSKGGAPECGLNIFKAKPPSMGQIF
jgi:hypothetical protein